MQRTPAVVAALLMASLALAGCTGGGELDMLVTPSDDPVTQPYIFEATGPSYDNYVWDFGDGFVEEGAEVEHLFGFTNGDVAVTLTASNEGEEEVTIRRSVSLGGTRNVNPQGAMITNSYWINPGDEFVIDASQTIDADGDPLLFRWTCERVADLLPIDTSHAPHGDFGGVPFGVDAWAELDTNLSAEPVDFGTDLCSSLSPSRDSDWSRDVGAIQGSITESGTYVLEVFVRDPKGTPWVGRTNFWVASEDRLKPEPTRTIGPIEGTFQGGAGGEFDGFYHNGQEVGGQNTPPPSEVSGEGNETFDRYVYPFTLDLTTKSGCITFSHDGSTDSGEVVEYTVYRAGSETPSINAQSGDYCWDNTKTLRNAPDGGSQDYEMEFILTQGTQVNFEFTIDLVHDIDNPLHWHELPPI